ncbi:uncharacterized protein LY79DRAFT_540751 [Colletotrichum navitas]|uniref:Uncharacterized protein n=1 Tax=Colletotrichum navitas TaxID=681940 RepID=A0AAD8V9X9_9PEZI|nr:uncharacterized protein LY79DRAFT_540751 [Colletotrichum navitas]KAK1597693.1 hypothetical protein LY79DRAFT_540751 [Colletotrichum navitas]
MLLALVEYMLSRGSIYIFCYYFLRPLFTFLINNPFRVLSYRLFDRFFLIRLLYAVYILFLYAVYILFLYAVYILFLYAVYILCIYTIHARDMSRFFAYTLTQPSCQPLRI